MYAVIHCIHTVCPRPHRLCLTTAMLASPPGRRAGPYRKSIGAATTTIRVALCHNLMTVMRAFLNGRLGGRLARKTGAAHIIGAAVYRKSLAAFGEIRTFSHLMNLVWSSTAQVTSGL